MTVGRLPGPRENLLLGSLRPFRRNMLEFLQRLSRDYGPICGFRLGYVRCCLINDPALIEAVLQPRTDSLIKPWDLRQLRVVLGNGLLTSEGELWRHQRRLLQPAFHNDRVRAYASIMAEETQTALQEWHDGQVRELHADMARLTLRIASRALFGTDISDSTQAVGSALDRIMRHFETAITSGLPLPFRWPIPRNRDLHRAIAELDEVIYRIIRERRQRGSRDDDLLASLLALQKDDPGMTDRQVRDEVMTLLLAGHETTALALTWTLYLLGVHPEIEARVRAEVVAALGKSVSVQQCIGDLILTRAALKEAMRLYPPAWGIGREPIHEFPLGGYAIPKGTQIFMLQYLMHRNPRYFSDPDDFRPERWSEEMEHRLPKYAYFPFGGGPRFCLGSNFAMMEATLVLALILSRWHLEAAPGQRIVPQPAVTLRPRHGIKVILRAAPADPG